jgi:hypothetical protein
MTLTVSAKKFPANTEEDNVRVFQRDNRCKRHWTERAYAIAA